VTLAAPAKLNLRLAVGRRRPDGYHPVRTLMVALDGLADTVEVAAASARSLDCPGIEGPANLAWRALDALEREAGRPLPVAIRIAKRIPTGAGLGGGSSDAASTLVAVDRLYELGLGAERLERVAAAVGSDVPFFIRGGAQWAEGRGERLRPAGAVPVFWAVLLQREPGLATAAVYEAFDRLPPPAPDDGSEPAGGPADLARWARNDLWPAALALQPRLGGTARALSSAGASAVVLCGSGSCVAGIFADRDGASRARARLGGGAFTALVRGPAGAPAESSAKSPKSPTLGST
jgi:4-diphosphocytidyl-2-C-methyl-D-erythritol kinase